MFLSKSSINILLFIGVCVLAFGAWIGQMNKNGEGFSSPQFISPISPTTITTIEISKLTDIKAKLEKRQGKWFVTQPINIEANNFLANNVTKLLSREYSKSMLVDETVLAEFGLSPALFTLQLNQQQLYFGQRNRISNQRYVLYDDTIYLIRDQLLPILNGAPASFVSHSIVSSGARIIALEFADFSLTRKNSKWILRLKTKQTPQYSQDELIAFLDEWKLAQALYVSLARSDTNSRNDNTAKNTIFLADGKSIKLTLSHDEIGGILYRPDPGIYYHMHNEAIKTLFSPLKTALLNPNL